MLYGGVSDLVLFQTRRRGASGVGGRGSGRCFDLVTSMDCWRTILVAKVKVN
mgnify:CR=1 FL=1